MRYWAFLPINKWAKYDGGTTEYNSRKIENAVGITADESYFMSPNQNCVHTISATNLQEELFWMN